jgi:hypothetical protein
MRLRIVATVALLPALAAAGCGGRGEASTPVACLEGPGAYLRALAAAPATVELGGAIPIGDCLAENQQAGDLATVGEAMVTAATRLNAEARANPDGPAALRLGYLLGAAERRAESTEGIHAELVRRLTVAARYSPEGPLPPAFAAVYRRGFDAGRESG